MRRFIVCFAYLFSYSAIAQDIDSLKNLISRSAAKDTTYILNLSELAYQLYSINPDSSLLLAEQAEKLSREIDFGKGLGRSIRVKGIYSWTKGNYEEAIRFFQVALSFSEKAKDPKGVASCQLNLGVVNRNQGNYQKAIEYFFSSLKIRELIKDEQGIATCNNNLGLVYQALYDNDKALKYFGDALAVQRKINDKPGMGRSYLNIGIALENLNRKEDAIGFFENSLNTAKAIGDQRGSVMAMDNLADALVSAGQLEGAKQFLNEGLLIASRNGFKDRIADLKETYAYYHNKSGNYAEALKEAAQAKDLASEIRNADILKGALEQYSLAASKLGRYKEALEAHLQFTKLKDSVWNDEIKRKALSGEFEFKEEKMRIEQEKKELEAKASEERQKRLVNTFGGISFTIAVIAIFIYVSGRKIRSQNSELDAQRKELALQNEEISSQRDLVSLQNAQLEKAHKVIEEQNAEIRIHNQTLTEEVEKRTKDLIDYNHQLEQFAYMAAHNLRAPVARILGLNNLLTTTTEKSEDNNLILQKLASATHELDSVVKDISLILQHRRDITSTLTPISVQKEFDAIKFSLEEEIRNTNVSIVEDFSKTETILTVRSYFQNIFLHLIGNAIKYCDPARPLVIKISSEIQPDYFVFSVTDNGLGINLDLYRDKLFELYTRFHFHVEGKGLGLYIVKTQITIMGGKLVVESRPGVGSTFRVYLPTSSMA